MLSLLEAAKNQRDEFVREHRKAPTVELIRVKGDRLLGLLTDVGSDFVEMSGFYTGSPTRRIARSQIAEIEFLKEKPRGPDVEGNELEPIYRAQDAAYEERYGPRD